MILGLVLYGGGALLYGNETFWTGAISRFLFPPQHTPRLRDDVPSTQPKPTQTDQGDRGSPMDQMALKGDKCFPLHALERGGIRGALVLGNGRKDNCPTGVFQAEK